jgi:hypothetical protein
MRTQINHPNAFSFVVLQRQVLEEKILLQKGKKDNHLYAKRNLFWIGLAYSVGLFVLFFI